jgi:hypothetical protein
VTRSVDPYPADLLSHDHGLVLAETNDVGSDGRAAGVFERSLLCRLDPLWQDQQHQVLRNFLSGVSKAETVTTFHPDRGLQICAKCDEGSSGLPIASTRPFELVAKASTASKIGFGTPQACLPNISGFSA